MTEREKEQVVATAEILYEKFHADIKLVLEHVDVVEMKLSARMDKLEFRMDKLEKAVRENTSEIKDIKKLLVRHEALIAKHEKTLAAA